MKKHKTGTAFFVCLILLIALLGVLFSVTRVENKKITDVNLFTDLDFKGTYSADGNEAVSINSKNEFNLNKYKEVVLKGKLSEKIPDDKYLIISICDAWLEFEVNGKPIADNYTDEGLKINSPGISYMYVKGADIPENAEITMKFKNPYTKLRSLNPVEDSLNSMGYGEKDAPYSKLLHEEAVSIFLSLAISFLGYFALMLAGLLWKNIIFRNLTLAFLAIVGGAYVLTDALCQYLPLWIENPVMCLVIDEFPMFLLPIAIFLYVRQFVGAKRTKQYFNILTAGSIILCATAYLFQIIGFMDILLAQYYLMFFIEAGAVGTIVALIYEGFFIKTESTKKLLLTITPVIAASFFDTLNALIAFAPGKSTMRLGLLFTIASQLYFLIVETISHNKELAKYQQMQHELLQMRVAIMVSQIQPHFLYNSLTSIAQLCEKNPREAKKATIEFADYMRHNMNSLKDEKPVEFESELSHLKVYLSLEKMRFGEDLNIVFNITTTDFLVPSLAVQPLVENAVKHGVGMKEDGGTVTIETMDYDDRVEVVVSDDGVGFDMSAPKNDGKVHVGLENVRRRIRTMCNGDLVVSSEINKGTVARIVLPKEDDEDENISSRR